MGYYTRYDISDNDPTVQEAIEEKSGYTFYSGQSDNVKWYNCEKDCKATSKDFPNTLITVAGDGEEQGDQWKAYFKNGKMQKVKAIISFDAFDEDKLK